MNRKKIVKLKKINIKRYFSLFISLMLILNSVNHQFIDNKVFAGKEGLSGTDENLSEVQKVQEVENEIVDNFEGLKFSFNTQNKTASVIGFEEGTETDKLSIPQCVNTANSGDFRVYKICSKAFEGRLDLQEITFPETLEVIEENAFYGCENLKKVTFQENSNLESICKNAFTCCLSLESVHFPNSLKSIGSESFQYCTNLKSVIFPENLSVIEGKAFCCCSGLTDIAIPSNVIQIEFEAFAHCSSLKSVILPENLSVIEGGTFCCCSGLTDIAIPSNVIQIKFKAFAHCSSLKSVILPENLSVIEGEAFYFCSGLIDITILSNVIQIESEAFYDCRSLEHVCFRNLFNNTINIKENAFSECDNFKQVEIPETGVYTQENLKFNFNLKDMTADIIGFANDKKACKQLNIPDYVKTSLGNFKVCKICSKAFEGRLDLQEITFPKTLKIIEENAFFQCENLKKVTFQKDSNLEYIYKNAFGYCLNLEGVNFPNSLKNIGSESFQYCTNLKNVILPESIDLIEERTFYNCSNLTQIDIPKNVICIEKEAFKRCFNLKTINFSESLETIEEGAFSRCESLKEVVLSSFVKTIGSEAFKCCTNLTKVILPDSVGTIGSGAFEWCTNLTNVILPKNIDFKSIEERTFCKCSKLEEISLPEQINTIESHAFYQCDNLKTVDFLKTLTLVLESRSFYECKNLKIDKKIFCKFSSYEGAFFGCNLAHNPTLLGIEFDIDDKKQIAYIKKYKDISQQYVDDVFYIPENLEIDGSYFKVCGIKDKAFEGASNFKVIYIPKTIEFIGNKVFLNCKNLTKVVCDDCETLSIAKDAFKNCESLESVVFLNKGFCFNNKTKEVFKFSELLKEKKTEEEKQYEKRHDKNYDNSFRYPYGKLKLSLADKVETLDEPKNIYMEACVFDFRVRNRHCSEYSPLFEQLPSVFDVQQSYFGNCYFLASFIAFLSIPGNAEKILENIKDNNDGTVTIALFNKCGNKIFVKVNRKIPEAITENGNLAILNEREFTDWISLWFKTYVAASNCEVFEEFKKKVYASKPVKNMTYDTFSSGRSEFVFSYVFGFFNNTIVVTEDKNFSLEEKKEIIEKIKYNIKERLPIVCDTKEKVNKKILVKNHCYALVGISERNKKFYLQLIDPHGRDLFKRLPFNKKSLSGASGLFSIKFEKFFENSSDFVFTKMQNF